MQQGVVTMPSVRLSEQARTAFEESLADARVRLNSRNFAAAWRALERAHILGQSDAWLHFRSHASMLRCGIAELDLREAFGQVIRMALAIPSSALGRYPVGNTGRARVSLFRAMPLPAELESLLSGDSPP